MMNKRIKELAVKAKLHMVSEPRMQEFAELIVRECLNQLQELVPPQVINENHQELVNSAHSYALVVSSAKIKKHFGVEG